MRAGETRFDAEVATFILERYWHETQEFTQNADGTVEVRMQVCLSPEVDMMLLPWAGHMEVLSPPELQDHFHEIGESLKRRHPKRPKPSA